MKYKDYKRLAKISLKARKKTTRSTVRGISFGLILLMPLLFIVIAFHIDLNKEVNKDASMRVFNIAYSKEMDENVSLQTMNPDYSQKVYDLDGVENIIKYNNYSFDNSKSYYEGEELELSLLTVTIGNNTFSLDYEKGSREKHIVDVGMQVFDTSVGNSLFLKADSEVLGGKNPLVSGNEFSNNSSGEIMVSSNFLKHYNLNSSDVINKKITINYELYDFYQATTSRTEITSTDLNMYEGLIVTVVKDFKIVGVFDSDIYNSSVRSDTQNDESYFESSSHYETYFWLTEDSLHDTLGNSYLQEHIRIEIESDYGDNYFRSAYYYADNPVNLSKQARNNKKAFIPLGIGVSKQVYGNSVVSEYNTLVEFKSYDYANAAVSTIDSLYKSTAGNREDINVYPDYMQSTFENYRMFYNVFTYATLVLAIFGGVVFFATLLNLYNTIHYSVQSRRNYLGMIRAIGMKGKDVIKMYFVEIFQIFKRTYVWTILFGGGICYGISYLFDSIMKSDVGESITIKLSLNPIYILVAFLVLLIINTLISIAFSLIACNNVSKKPILEVLEENR